MDMIPLSVDPSSIVLMTWDEIEETFAFLGMLSENVFLTEDYAVKSHPKHVSTIVK